MRDTRIKYSSILLLSPSLFSQVFTADTSIEQMRKNGGSMRMFLTGIAEQNVDTVVKLNIAITGTAPAGQRRRSGRGAPPPTEVIDSE